MLQALLLVFALCIDAFATSITYGIGKIKIPIISSLIISFVGASFLGIALFLSSIIQHLISTQVCIGISVVLLLFLGIVNLFQNSIKAYLRKCKGQKNVQFSFLNINFVLDVYLDETKADADNSNVLSSKEALMLAIALSVDSLATGFSAGLGEVNGFGILFFCFVFGFLCVNCGCQIGQRISMCTSINLSWISGIVLIILALIKFL